MTLNCGARTASDLVHALRCSKSVRLMLSAADLDASLLPMPAKRHMIRPLKTRFTNTTVFTATPGVVANHRFSFLD